MPGNPHPIDAAIVDGAAVGKSAMRGYEKQYVCLRVADAAAIRNTDFSGQYGFLYVASLSAFFALDASDTTSTDDGATCIIDAAGNRFKRLPLTPPYREKLSANRTYYVRTDGNDANNGLANNAGGAFRTLQHAWDVVAALDLSIYTVTVQIADGTYNGITAQAVPVGTTSVVFQGNAATPANVLINSANGFFLNGPAQITVKDLKLACSGTCFYVQHLGAKLQFGNVNFGASGDHIRFNVGHVKSVSGYTISGGASRHLLGVGPGLVEIGSVTVTITGTPNFSDAFISMMGTAGASLWSITWSGSATGVRYYATSNGVINSFGQGTASTWFPGSSNGSTSTGGQQV